MSKRTCKNFTHYLLLVTHKTRILMKHLLAVFTLFILITLPTLLLAQPGLPSSPEQTPLGGLEILAALGGGYAIKKLRDRNKS